MAAGLGRPDLRLGPTPRVEHVTAGHRLTPVRPAVDVVLQRRIRPIVKAFLGLTALRLGLAWRAKCRSTNLCQINTGLLPILDSLFGSQRISPGE